MMFGPAQVLPVAATSTSVDVFEGAAILHGWSWRETTDLTRAEVELRDGAGGPSIVTITLDAGESTRDWLSGAGIYVRTGLYVAVTSGTVKASLWALPLASTDLAEPVDVRAWLDELIDILWVR